MRSPTEKMIAEKDGAIGWITFNNPDRRNAVSLEMWAALDELLAAMEADDEIRAIVLKGAGDRAFVSGADISQFEDQRANADASAHYDAVSSAAVTRLQNVTKPTIAMIRGYCIGGGLGIAITCDLRIAADDARFAIPAARLGLGYGATGIKRLIDVIGPSFAKEIFYTARQFDAAEARAMTLVNQVVPVAELEAYTRDYCGRIAANAPLTISAVKQITEELLRAGDGYDAGFCEELVRTCFNSADYVEGRRAFMEKRTPQFRGR